jgi:hypothetical protein
VRNLVRGADILLSFFFSHLARAAATERHTYRFDPPRPPSPRSSPTIGALGKQWTTTMMVCPRRASRTFFVLIIPARLHRHCCRSPPPKTPFPKLAEDDLQEITRVTPCFRVSVVVILRCNAAALIVLPILPPNEQCADVDRRHRRCCSRQTLSPPRRGAVDTTIEQKRILSAWTGGGRSCLGSVGGRRRRIRRTPPPP